MAAPTNAFDTYESIGNREDLSDFIYDVSPTETPILSAMPKGKASATFHEWQTDVLASASATNAQVEGDDYSGAAITPTVRLGNYTQIFAKAYTITETQEAISKAGRKRESAYQAVRRGQEVKRDIESSIFANNARAAGNATTARELAGLPAWIKTNVSSTGTDSSGTGTDARTDATTGRAFTEALLKAAIQTGWSNGSKIEGLKLVAGAVNRGKLSTFTGSNTRFNRMEDGRLSASIRIYESDFGAVVAVPCRHTRANDVFLLDTEMLSWKELRPMASTQLAKTGDAEKYLVRCEATLEVKNEKAHCAVYDLTTT